MRRSRGNDDTYISLFKNIHASMPFSVSPKPAAQQVCSDSYVRKNLTAIHFEQGMNQSIQFSIQEINDLHPKN